MSRRSVLSAIITVFSVSTAHAYMDDFCLPTFYLGGDIQDREMRFVQDFGSNVNKHSYPQGNIYLGVKINDYFGVEAGVERSGTRTRSIAIPAGSPLYGLSYPIDLQLKVITRLRGSHTSLISYLPIFGCNNLSLLLGIGITNQKITLQNIITQIGDETGLRTIQFSQSKNLLRLMTGFQYMFSKYIGIRGNIHWENTGELNNIEPIRQETISKAKTKNSIVYGIGILLQF